MDLNFKIIWFEDIDEWYNTLSRRLSRYIKAKNLKVKIDRIANLKEFSLNKYELKEYDLLIVDYELDKVVIDGIEKTFYGSEVINTIRSGNFVNDVLFYSSHGFEIINNVMKEEGLQGVFIADRNNEEFMERAQLLVDKAVRRTENLINIRGIVMDTTSDFDNKIRDIISLIWLSLGDKEGKIVSDIKKKILLDNKKTAEKLVEKYSDISKDNINQLLNERDFSAIRQARLLSWCIDANEDLKPQLYEIIKKYSEITNEETFFQVYQKEIINYRNALAHVKNSPEGEGVCYIGEFDGHQIAFNEELCIKLRNSLLRYDTMFDEIYSCLEER